VSDVCCPILSQIKRANTLRPSGQAGSRGETLCPIHCRGKRAFRYSHASMLKWSAAATCMNHMLWKTFRTSTGRQVLPRTQEIYKALEENHGQCHTRLKENL